jgi:hypothetical protein
MLKSSQLTGIIRLDAPSGEIVDCWKRCRLLMDTASLRREVANFQYGARSPKKSAPADFQLVKNHYADYANVGS